MARFIKTLAFALCVFAGFTNLSLAADSLGTAFFEGRKITLFKDGTWAYQDEDAKQASSGCTSISNHLEACLENSGWKPYPQKPAHIDFMYFLDDRNFLMFIEEATGADDGMNIGFMRDAAISNFSNGFGIAKDDIEIEFEGESIVDGKPAYTLGYGGKASGPRFVYLNTIVISDNETVQLLTFTLGKYTDEFKAKHDAMLSTIKFKK